MFLKKFHLGVLCLKRTYLKQFRRSKLALHEDTRFWVGCVFRESLHRRNSSSLQRNRNATKITIPVLHFFTQWLGRQTSCNQKPGVGTIAPLKPTIVTSCMHNDFAQFRKQLSPQKITGWIRPCQRYYLHTCTYIFSTIFVAAFTKIRANHPGSFLLIFHHLNINYYW